MREREGKLGEKRRIECERVVRAIEARIESFMPIEGGEGPYEYDGVKSILLGFLEDKCVEVAIHVQPGLDDDYWRS